MPLHPERIPRDYTWEDYAPSGQLDEPLDMSDMPYGDDPIGETEDEDGEEAEQ